MPRLSPILTSGDLPAAELQAARLDGELFTVGDCFCPIDEIETPAHRAAALGVALPDRLIAEQFSAAWVWGAGPPPARHQFCARSDSRVRPAAKLRITVREVVIDEASVVEVGDLSVTSVLRTIVDIARFSPHCETGELEVLAALMRMGGLTPADCEDEIESRRNLPNKRRALRRIRLAC